MGFSHRMCLPAAAAASTCSWWLGWGEVTTMASMSGRARSAATDGSASAAYCAASAWTLLPPANATTAARSPR